MKMNMIELESGTIKLRDNRWQHFRRVLETILPHWIEETRLGGKGIQLFLLQDSKKADCRKEISPPIIILRALRERENDPGSIAGYELLETMQAGIYIDLLIDRLGKIFKDDSRMQRLWEEENQRTNPESSLGQGDGCFRAYKIVFSTYYYDTHLRLYLSYHYTPA